MSSAARTYVPNRRDATHIRQSETFEDKGEQREAVQESRRLTQQERMDLLYHWGGYEAAVGCRSAMGAIMSVALRAPPRERPTWLLVEEELARHAGSMPVERLERVIAADGMATRYEVRNAVRGMMLAGRAQMYVADAPIRDGQDGRAAGTIRRNADGAEVVVPTSMVRILPRQTGAPLGKSTPEDRWARQDAALELYARGTIRCHDTQSGKPRDDDQDSWLSTGSLVSDAARSLSRILGRDRMILERVYGSALGNSGASHKDLFGAELAVVVPYTSALETVRQALVERTLAKQTELVELTLARLTAKWETATSEAESERVEGLAPLERHRERTRIGCARKAGRPPRPDMEALSISVDRSVTAADALRSVLDDQPKEPKAEKRWREERAAFIKQAKLEADRLLAGACAAYRRGML